ncbi:MAG: response regulator [Nitrospirae bacterium]|nr:response regulator [Nitrospirota bacterium]
MSCSREHPVEILLIDDNPADKRLAIEAFKECKTCHHLNTVDDGVEAMEFLQRKGPYADAVKPDLIILDLNLPRKDGREVLADVRGDQALKYIPIVVMSISDAGSDILNIYNLGANCYITKPIDLEQFIHVVRRIEEFWFQIVKLPPR